jgi:DNA polymerase/3'-5' exonuclease PolX
MRSPLELATDLVERLRPGCHRIEIAGSLRRGKPNPKDIEIVCEPYLAVETHKDLFGESNPTTRNYLEIQLEELYANGTGIWTLDPDLRRNGAKYKRLKYWGAGSICCDLFITNPESWGVIFAIRTGPADFSKMLVTKALKMGMKVEDGRLWRIHRDDSKTPVVTHEESDFFKALDVSLLPPNLRVA